VKESTHMTEINPQLDWLPQGRPTWHAGWINGYARGLDLILDYLGHDVDYDTIMGDMGLAFIMQGEENSINLFEGAVDVGWWPLEPLGFIRLNFLERTVGREIKDAMVPPDERGEDPPTIYKRWFEPVIVSSLDNRRPCVARVGSAWYVVTGYDDEAYPLIGMCPNEEQGKERIYRVEEAWPPYAALAVGEAVPAIDRGEADIEALKYAVALHRDRVLGPDVAYAGDDPLRRAEAFGTWWRTGLKSFACWIACLEDSEHLGYHYWHGNVQGFLVRNRRTSVRYLEAMQRRCSEAVAAHLGSAMQAYQAVVKGEVDANLQFVECPMRPGTVERAQKARVAEAYRFPKSACYVPRNVAGALRAAGEPELARDFIGFLTAPETQELMLSSGMRNDADLPLLAGPWGADQEAPPELRPSTTPAGHR